jgi:hypothetical protein
MAESFGTHFTLVEVTSDALSSRPIRQVWLALAKPGQAPTLVLSAVPEGWTAKIIYTELTEDQQSILKETR